MPQYKKEILNSGVIHFCYTKGFGQFNFQTKACNGGKTPSFNTYIFNQLATLHFANVR